MAVIKRFYMIAGISLKNDWIIHLIDVWIHIFLFDDSLFIRGRLLFFPFSPSSFSVSLHDFFLWNNVFDQRKKTTITMKKNSYKIFDEWIGRIKIEKMELDVEQLSLLQIDFDFDSSLFWFLFFSFIPM